MAVGERGDGMKLRLKLLKESHNLNLKEFAKTIKLKESTTAN